MSLPSSLLTLQCARCRAARRGARRSRWRTCPAWPSSSWSGAAGLLWLPAPACARMPAADAARRFSHIFRPAAGDPKTQSRQAAASADGGSPAQLCAQPPGRASVRARAFCVSVRVRACAAGAHFHLTQEQRERQRGGNDQDLPQERRCRHHRARHCRWTGRRRVGVRRLWCRLTLSPLVPSIGRRRLWAERASSVMPFFLRTSLLSCMCVCAWRHRSERVLLSVQPLCLLCDLRRLVAAHLCFYFLNETDSCALVLQADRRVCKCLAFSSCSHWPNSAAHTYTLTQ